MGFIELKLYVEAQGWQKQQKLSVWKNNRERDATERRQR